jgi:hypothetical protein
MADNLNVFESTSYVLNKRSGDLVLVGTARKKMSLVYVTLVMSMTFCAVLNVEASRLGTTVSHVNWWSEYYVIVTRNVLRHSIT